MNSIIYRSNWIQRTLYMELLALDLELALLFLYMHLYLPPELLAPTPWGGGWSTSGILAVQTNG
nr:hypothetical protein Q903MT_gene1820 [Picea sitchensis]